jgi:hypothetical protein
VPNDGFDIDPFETNKVIVVAHKTVTIGASGFVDVPVVLSDTHERAGVNTFVAAVQDTDGRTSLVSNFIVVALNDDPASSSTDVTGLLAGDYDGTGTVDDCDYMCWRTAFGDTGDGLLADGNGNGVVDAADYVVWRHKYGASLPESAAASGSQTPSEQPVAVAVSFNGGSSATTIQAQRLAELIAPNVVVEKLDRTSTGASKRFGSSTRLGRLAQSHVTNRDLLTLAESLASQASEDRARVLSKLPVNEQSRPDSLHRDALELAFESLGELTISPRYLGSIQGRPTFAVQLEV